VRTRRKSKERGLLLQIAQVLLTLAMETAEACAEWLRRCIREEWGFPDPPEMTMAQRFTPRYRGNRYSFGYPACPNLEDQAALWRLVKPGQIGVQLTEGFRMDPEASVSVHEAHHPCVPTLGPPGRRRALPKYSLLGRCYVDLLISGGA
jgi:5-methyltetrahydrofolate--homocysteine methyltransferase